MANKERMYIATLARGMEVGFIIFFAESIQFANDHAEHVANSAGWKVERVERCVGYDPKKAGQIVSDYKELEAANGDEN